MKYDYLIVGSGLYGSVFAYEANKRGKKCLVIDKRNHVGGNIYCEEIEGIHVHKYGAHIFHTSNKAVWEYVSQFAEFNNYVNSPVAARSERASMSEALTATMLAAGSQWPMTVVPSAMVEPDRE